MKKSNVPPQNGQPPFAPPHVHAFPAPAHDPSPDAPAVPAPAHDPSPDAPAVPAPAHDPSPDAPAGTDALESIPAHDPSPGAPGADDSTAHDPSPDAPGADDSRAISMGGGYFLSQPDTHLAQPDSTDISCPSQTHSLPLLPQDVNPSPAYDLPATTTTRQACPLLKPGATAPPPSPPRACDVTDPEIFWLNSRPYLLQCSVGKGGFGEVHRVEMMLPLGMEVRRNPKTGAFVLDEDGRVCVRLTEERSVPVTADKSSGAANMGHQRGGDAVAAGEAVAKALQLSEAAPDSMRFFSLKETVEDADGKGADGTFLGIHIGVI